MLHLLSAYICDYHSALKSNLINQNFQNLEQADEEFNIEKGKIVRAETVNIEAFFQKKLKQSDIQRKMYESLVARMEWKALFVDLLLSIRVF